MLQGRDWLRWTGMISLRSIGPFHPEVTQQEKHKCCKGGTGFAGPSPTTGYLASLAKPSLLCSNGFLFSVILTKTSFRRIPENKNPMISHRVLHILRCGRDSNPRPSAWQADILTKLNYRTIFLIITSMNYHFQKVLQIYTFFFFRQYKNYFF